MNILDKVKKFVNFTEDSGDFDDVETAEFDQSDDFDYVPEPEYQAPTAVSNQTRSRVSFKEKVAPSQGNVVDINSKPAPAAAKPHVVFQKIDTFEEVGAVADILIDRRIVVLNLETCPNDVSQRIIDFLFGVAYANHGDFKKVAGRAYIITPYNVSVSGEMIDELAGFGE